MFHFKDEMLKITIHIYEFTIPNSCTPTFCNIETITSIKHRDQHPSRESIKYSVSLSLIGYTSIPLSNIVTNWLKSTITDTKIGKVAHAYTNEQIGLIKTFHRKRVRL